MNKRFFDLLTKASRPRSKPSNTAWVALEEIDRSGVLSTPTTKETPIPVWLKSVSEARRKEKESPSFTKYHHLPPNIRKQKYSTFARRYSNVACSYPLVRLDTLGGMCLTRNFVIELRLAIEEKDLEKAWRLYSSLLHRIPNSIHHGILIEPSRRYILRNLLAFLSSKCDIYDRTNLPKQLANYILLVAYQVRQFQHTISEEKDLLFCFAKAYHILNEAHANLVVLDRLSELGADFGRVDRYRKHALYACWRYDEFISLFDEEDVNKGFRDKYLLALIKRKETMKDAVAFVCRYPHPSSFVVIEGAIIAYGLQDEFSSRLRALQDEFSSQLGNELYTGYIYNSRLFRVFVSLKRDDLSVSLFEEKLRHEPDLLPRDRDCIMYSLTL
jgi:hypothetical protein